LIYSKDSEACPKPRASSLIFQNKKNNPFQIHILKFPQAEKLSFLSKIKLIARGLQLVAFGDMLTNTIYK
jgi:hypothetical protein